MNKSVVLFLIVCGVFAGTARQASAQGATWADRGYINVGWGVESGSSAMSDTRTSTIYEETATVTSSSTFTSGSLFDVGVGLRIWRNLTVGVAYHQEQNDTEGTADRIDSEPGVLQPSAHARPSAVAGLDRKEKATHLQIGWVMPFGEQVRRDGLRRPVVLPAGAGSRQRSRVQRAGRRVHDRRRRSRRSRRARRARPASTSARTRPTSSGRTTAFASARAGSCASRRRTWTSRC